LQLHRGFTWLALHSPLRLLPSALQVKRRFSAFVGLRRDLKGLPAGRRPRLPASWDALSRTRTIAGEALRQPWTMPGVCLVIPACLCAIKTWLASEGSRAQQLHLLRRTAADRLAHPAAGAACEERTALLDACLRDAVAAGPPLTTAAPWLRFLAPGALDLQGRCGPAQRRSNAAPAACHMASVLYRSNWQ
jgi:hypothetical protein